MKIEVVFFQLWAIVFFTVAAFEGTALFKKRNQIGVATGRIVDISMPAAKTMEIFNSKWATVTFNVGSNRITSKNRVQVPKSSEIGDEITIKYDIQNPEYLIPQTIKTFVIFLSGSILSLLISFLLA